MKFQKSQPAEAAHVSDPHSLVGPTENMVRLELELILS